MSSMEAINLKFFLFVIFNHNYKDGNHKKDAYPYSGTVFTFLLYEAVLLIMMFHIIEKFIGIPLLSELKSWGRLIGPILLLILYPINHLFFVKKNGLNNIYNEFKDSEINTKRNRRIYGAILILIFLLLILVAGNLKYIFN